MLKIFVWLLAASTALAATGQGAQLITDVKCAADPSETYALFIPSGYTPARAWPVILGFDPGGRGRTPVERFQAAAAEYGFIVAGSNNARNGSPETTTAVAAMSADVMSRFHIDEQRIYTAGMSGGARVALAIGLTSPQIAGVIASSAGYPDSVPRKNVSFALFATAGTEDFNHLEMRQLDRALTSPHHLAIFEGGHAWLSSDLAVEAVEWMEIQAMRTGLKARDAQEIDRIFAKHVATVGANPAGASAKDAFLALESIAADFDGLKDVSSIAARAAALGRDKDVRKALKKDRDDDDREERTLNDIRAAEQRLASVDDHAATLLDLRRRWKELSDAAKAPADSSERRLARRVVTGLSAGRTSTDPEYLKIISEYRLGRGGP